MVFAQMFNLHLQKLLMKTNILILFFLAATNLLFSCSKDKNDGPGTEYTYKLTGPGTVKVQVQYTPTLTDPNMTEVPDETIYEELVTPPWQKTVSIHKNVSGVGFSASVSEGTPGAKYTISVLSNDGTTLKTADFTLDAYGDGVMLINYYRN